MKDRIQERDEKNKQTRERRFRNKENMYLTNKEVAS